MEATVAERGQITLPKAVRDALGLTKGTVLKVELDGGRIILRKDVAESQTYIQRVSAQRELHFFLSHLGDGQHDAGKAIPVSPDQRSEQVNRE